MNLKRPFKELCKFVCLNKRKSIEYAGTGGKGGWDEGKETREAHRILVYNESCSNDGLLFLVDPLRGDSESEHSSVSSHAFCFMQACEF